MVMVRGRIHASTVTAFASRRLVLLGTTTRSLTPSKSRYPLTVATPVDTTSATLAPGATLAPPAGCCEITRPAGTVSLLAVLTPPTARPASAIALSAAAWVRSTTSGTVTVGRPVEITSATLTPGATLAPPAGCCEITCPSGTVSLLAVLDPAQHQSGIHDRALRRRLGQAHYVGYHDRARANRNTSATLLPASTLAPASGSCDITLPAGTVH